MNERFPLTCWTVSPIALNPIQPRYCAVPGFVILLATLLTAAPVLAQDPLPLVTGLQRDVIFSAYSPLSRSLELARRTLSPLANVEVARVAAQLRPQAIDLTQETFSMYVPTQPASKGYGLIVFIPPWQDARLPPGWDAVLNETGMIFITAAKSGNEANVIDRRMPLALLGAYNVMQRYPIDSDRVYIGGFSGGSRVAMKVALAYPDLFHGALLNAGSDPIGNREAIMPPDDLFAQFQSSSRLVYVTGSSDSWNIEHDTVSRDSMNVWCVFGTRVETMLRAGHEVATPSSLRRALFALDQRAPLDPNKLSACRARQAMVMATELNNVQQLLDHAKPRDAWHSLNKIDAHYGGLASAAIIEFAQRIGSEHY